MKKLSFVMILMFLAGCSTTNIQQSETYDPFTKITYKNINLGISTRGASVDFATLIFTKSSEGVEGAVTLTYIRGCLSSLFAGKNHGIKNGDFIGFTLENTNQKEESLTFTVYKADYTSEDFNQAIITAYKGHFVLTQEQLNKIGSAQKVHYAIPTGYDPLVGEITQEQQKSLLEFIRK